MGKIRSIRVYNLVDSKGNKLQLELGTTDVAPDYYPASTADKGYRWRFIGKHIPMPVRSMTWFNGFPEHIMLDWLKGNGWCLHTRVDTSTGTATVYELPTSNGNNIPELDKEASAQEMYNGTIQTALEAAMKKISEAKDYGHTSCYISSLKGKIPVEVIQSLLDAGYDIKYKAYHNGYGDWFIEVFWSSPREKGKIFTGGSLEDPIEVTIQDYKNA